METAKLVLGLNLFVFQLKLLAFAADTYSRFDFPPGFVFGASASAYQYEGAASEDGRTTSIWDTYSHARNMGGNVDIASDGYHKYKEDIQLMADTGLDAYRFSISWSRIIPNGRGPVNMKGVQYYNNLINELISNGIQPHVTLNHFDLPQDLEDEYGGWINHKIVRDFTAYADVCFREFGDRVLHWTTLNEPNMLALYGYDVGFLPPQRCSPNFPFNCSKGNSSTEPYMAAHNILLAHAAVVKLYRTKYQDKQHGLIGLNLYNFWYAPSTNTTEDKSAAQRANDFYFGWFMHPLVYGDYPSSMKKNAGSRMPKFTNSQSKQIKGSFDFLGLNYYMAVCAKDYPGSLEMADRDVIADMAVDLKVVSQYNASEYEYPVDPWGLKGLLDYIKEAYGNPPIYIHENGQRTRRKSSLEDWSRVKFLSGYIGSVLDAIRDGSNTKAYFTWSFVDVFELLDGFASSFGLYYVDFSDPDLRRYPKLSAKWYSQFLKGQSVNRTGVIQLKGSSLPNPQFTH